MNIEQPIPVKMPRARTRAVKRRGVAKTGRVQGRRGLHDLLELYQGLSGFNASTIGLTEHKTTYGEVAEGGMKSLSDKFQEHGPITNFPPEQRAFFDIGCGIGRLNLGMAILHPEIQSKGVEIVPDRVRFAHQALERLRARQIAQRVQITHGSFLDVSYSYSSACWIFFSNLCFEEEVQKKLVEKLEAECKPGCIIICSRELLTSENSPFEKIEHGVPVQMTWSNTSTCFVYRRRA
jgi:SAM-dependent methyltransferase